MASVLESLKNRFISKAGRNSGADTTREEQPDNAVFAARSMFATTAHNGFTYLLGGWDSENRLYSDVWRSRDGARWERVCAEAPWQPRCYFNAVSFRGYLWIVGGFVFEPPSNVLGDIWRSADGVTWEQVGAAFPWEAREHHGLAVLGDTLYLFGGVTYLEPVAGGGLRAFQDVWASEDGAKWERVTDAAPWGPRRGFGYAAFEGRLWLYGGFDSADVLYRDVWSSSDGRNWTQISGAAPWMERGTFFGGAFDGRLWAMGGNVTGQQSLVVPANDVWSSRDGATWVRECEAAPWGPRAGETLISVPGESSRMLVVGGFRFDPTSHFYDDVWSSRDGRTWRCETDNTLCAAASPDMSEPGPTAKIKDENARTRGISNLWLDADVTKQFVADVSTPNHIGNLEFNDVFHHLVAPVFQAGQKILDVGCGPGLTSFFLHDRGCSMVATDYSQEMLNRLLEWKGDRDVEVRQGDAFSLPAKDEEFDGVVSRMFMTHFAEFQLILKEMTRVIRPGGSIAYSFANAEHFQAASRGPHPDARAFPLWPDRSKGSYSSMIDRAHLDYLCEAIGCDVVNVFPLGWLYDNATIAFSLGSERFETFGKTLAEYMQRPDVFEFMSWLDKEITPNLPPTTSFHNVTILRKR